MPSNPPAVQLLQQQAASLLIYQAVFRDAVGQAFLELLQELHAGDMLGKLEAYGRWFRGLAAGDRSWSDYLVDRILQDDNPFSRQAQSRTFEQLPPALVQGVRHDLQVLQVLSRCGGEQLAEWVQAPAAWVRESEGETLLQGAANWQEAIADLAAWYAREGIGIFARDRALRWQNGHFIGIPAPDPIKWAELTGYETQKAEFARNTEALLAGSPALHVLLYGSRGSGKSSLVKGLVNEYGDRGLRLIEVDRAQFSDLPQIVDQLRDFAQKFIIFVDDLSFEADDRDFKALKVVLEGSATARAQNVVVCATSNRRHLVREFFSDRPRPQDGDEVHAWDTMQEKLSFSDRFGLTLTFEPANQNTYLEIVHHLAEQAGIALPAEELEFRAKQWATRHNGRSGRTARQFIDFLAAELAVKSAKTLRSLDDWYNNKS